ncbi:unnamed protein product, partial [marine sediment metagenome]
ITPTPSMTPVSRPAMLIEEVLSIRKEGRKNMIPANVAALRPRTNIRIRIGLVIVLPNPFSPLSSGSFRVDQQTTAAIRAGTAIITAANLHCSLEIRYAMSMGDMNLPSCPPAPWIPKT